MPVEFLGNKSNLLEFIVPIIEQSSDPNQKEIVDLFCGTGSVSAAFKKQGYKVTANDQLTFCSHFAKATLLNSSAPNFSGIKYLINHKEKGSIYNNVLDYLNQLEPKEGFIYKNYSPASKQYSEYSRMYFTCYNAGKIDAIRSKLSEWVEVLKEEEWSLLVTNLLTAVSEISNTAGTYGCFLKKWKKRALNNMVLKPSKFINSKIENIVYCCDANKLAPEIKSRIIYADPPYTKRQYAAYYHILETIAIYDEPILIGSTGLRPWEENQSPYCHKRKAPSALNNLLESLQFNHFFLSYNQDGQIPHDQLIEILQKYGSVNYYEKEYNRYKSSGLPHKGLKLTERLYHIKQN